MNFVIKNCENVVKTLKVGIAVSGGVDSAVAALLLKQRGFDLIGIFMNNWIDDNNNSFCLNDENREYAKLVCNRLDIEFKEISFVRSYWNNVFSYLVDSYTTGDTPNPDIMCNKFVKFGSFLKYCIENLKLDAIATGHYAGSSYGNFWQNYNNESPVRLYRPRDRVKDQTFFLSQISQNSLKKAMFPLQHLLKAEVKSIAINSGFNKIAEKPESTGICFIGKRNFKKFIEEYVEQKPGNFIDIDTGLKVGDHKGIHYWTLGERCRIAGLRHSYFIVRKIPETNDILVASNTNHSSLYSRRMTTKEPNWICDEPKELSNGKQLKCLFKFQHVDEPQPCVVNKLTNNSLDIQLFEPMRAITSGQFAVLYKNEECIGSAPILDYRVLENY